MRAPAKLNLVLEVLGRRPDGFHELASVFAPLGLADELSAVVGAGAPPGDPRDRLSVLGVPALATSDNLVLRAAALLRAETGRSLAPLEFRLRKRIPVAAGLGGGSSDALAALELAAAAWGLRLGAGRRLALAAALGSDVPFFALRSWALVGGRGERLRRLPPPSGGPLGVLLVVPAARLPTRDVFAALDEGRRDRPARVPDGAPEAPGVRPGAAAELARRLRRGATAAQVADAAPANDLLPVAAALLPGLEPLRRALADLLDRPVHLSGSGPTLAVLYASPDRARRAAATVRAAAAQGSLESPGGALGVIATRTTGGAT
ncbi:MAG: 4-(cytidine 5'-diphospho)-2-C-methyl-D-erythritol kinase [Candidatus Limnocylindrales bacterium]